MPEVVGIRFKSCGKIYDFEVDGLEIEKGDAVVVESELGLSIGTVVVERHPFTGETKDNLKKVLRKAAEEDLRQKKDNEALENEARVYCLERIMARGLPMKLICTEATLDRKRIIFYFAAEGRIDFRELVKDLAAKFKTRIEMRQIGVRDEAKMLGGIGICGLELCCKRFLTTFEPISIRMAKSQELVLNANKLSGVCGRLMCCLSYEYSEEENSAPAAASAGTQTGDDADDGFRNPRPPESENGARTAEQASEEKRVFGSDQPRPDSSSVKTGEARQAPTAASSTQEKSVESAVSGAEQRNPDDEKKFHRRKRRRRRRHRR
jgi:cell fate regulator YaaT (PSP1 superfamily)